MLALTLVAVIFIAACGMAAVLMVVGNRTPKRRLYSELCEGIDELRAMRSLPSTRHDPPPMPECKTAREADKFRCINCGSLVTQFELAWGLCCTCQDKARREKPRDATFWDVAERDAQRGIDYRFIGQMGDSEY